MAQIPVSQGEYLADDDRDVILGMKSCLFQSQYPRLSVTSQHPSLPFIRKDKAYFDILLDRRVMELILGSNCQEVVAINVSSNH